MTKLKVAVVMGAESDLPVVKKAIDQLDALGVEREVRVLSAHRTPEEACKFAAGAKEAGFGVLICAAANAAILAAQMLALSDPELADRLARMRADMTAAVLESDKRVAEQFAR